MQEEKPIEITADMDDLIILITLSMIGYIGTLAQSEMMQIFSDCRNAVLEDDEKCEFRQFQKIALFYKDSFVNWINDPEHKVQLKEVRE